MIQWIQIQRPENEPLQSLSKGVYGRIMFGPICIWLQRNVCNIETTSLFSVFYNFRDMWNLERTYSGWRL